METEARFKASVSLRYTTVAASLDGLLAAVCLNCRGPLDVHQPDADLPDRMLGTCHSCKTWHMIDFDPDGTSAVVVMLPGFEPFRR